MFRTLNRLARAVIREGKRRLVTLINRVEARVRRLWRRHLSATRVNPVYAAAVAALIGGALGFVPGRDVLAAVLAAALGLLHTIAPSSAGSMRPAVDEVWARY